MYSRRAPFQERIELTFTKSCMDVVKTLSQSFNDVVRAKCGASSSSSNGNGNIDEDDDDDETDAASHEVDGSSCYVLVNDYGSDIRLSLADDQPFRVNFSSHFRRAPFPKSPAA